MRYKATLLGVPDLERPVQVFGISLSTVRNWAVDMIAKFSPEQYPEARVRIVEQTEVELEVVRHG